MAIDPHTLELLEFGRVRALLAERCVSAAGKRKAQALAPRNDLAGIRLSLQRVTEMADALEVRAAPTLGGIRDVAADVQRAALGVLIDPEQLLALRETLETACRVRAAADLLAPERPALAALCLEVRDGRKLMLEIDVAIDQRGKVRDDATPELAAVRRELAGYDARIQEELRRLLRSDDIRKALRYPQPTLCGEHHVLAVAVNYRQRVIGVVHRTSPTGETVYIEPAKVAAISAETSVLRSAEQREVRRALRRVCDVVRREAPALLLSLAALAELDLIAAAALWSREFDMRAPAVEVPSHAKPGLLYLPESRHPLLESQFRVAAEAGEEPRTVVPVSLRLGDGYDLLIVTGPNTGGKTAALKTAGLLAAMALSGLHLPTGRGAKVPLLSDILADIGDEQSLQQNLSTFSAHMTRMADILSRSGPATLALLDELGAGTEPGEGAALGRAILDELLERRCLGLVTTHLNDLKSYAFAKPRAENAAMEFDAESLRPSYKLLPGRIGQSCALKIAARLGLPERVLARAEENLSNRDGARSDEIAALGNLREEAEAARRDARAAQAEAERLTADLRLRTDNLQQEADVNAGLEKARQALRPGDAVRVAKFGRPGTVKRVDVRKRIAMVAVGAVEWELPLEELIPEAPGVRRT